MDNVAKFKDINYEDKSVVAVDSIFDEVETWDCFEDFWLRKKDIPGKTYAILFQDFADIINANNASCIFQGGEWWIPRKCGPERRKRQRTSNEQEIVRRAAITDPTQLQHLVTAGAANLKRFSSGILDAQAAPRALQGPTVEARQEDMPQLMVVTNTALEVVQREANK